MGALLHKMIPMNELNAKICGRIEMKQYLMTWAKIRTLTKTACTTRLAACLLENLDALMPRPCQHFHPHWGTLDVNLDSLSAYRFNHALHHLLPFLLSVHTFVSWTGCLMTLDLSWDCKTLG